MSPASSPLTIVHLSHLAWERRLFQRPQQLATRFAVSGNQVAYFSIVGMRRYMDMKLTERTIEDVDGHLHAQNLPWFPLSKKLAISRRASLALLESKAKAWLNKSHKGARVLWLQHPASLESTQRLPHDVLIYDAMDPFGAFKGSDADVLETENRLLEKADLVFTGGRSLHSAIVPRRSDAHCFPSGIDFEHFARGAGEGEIPADLKRLDKPVLGYFGAVDERIDWKLIEHICRERRHWSVVFLGPLVMMDRVPIDEPNFHWLGPKPYNLLPDYLRGFDVCLIPWLVNDLTKFMSPTKTPEYLAAGRPVVSTPIPDVVADYRDEVHVAGDAAGFVEKCTVALREGVSGARKPPQSRTWQETADEMLALIRARLA